MGILVEGDEALFGNVGKALERTVDFDLDSMATLQVFQGFTMALLGPLWATLCSRGTMNRQTILAILTFGQGLVTLVMAFNMTDMWTMRLLRSLNGACLSGMFPITFSIIADRFDDEVRGRMCALMNMAKGLGQPSAACYISRSQNTAHQRGGGALARMTTRAPSHAVVVVCSVGSTLSLFTVLWPWPSHH